VIFEVSLICTLSCLARIVYIVVSVAAVLVQSFKKGVSIMQELISLVCAVLGGAIIRASGDCPPRVAFKRDDRNQKAMIHARHPNGDIGAGGFDSPHPF